VEYSDGSEYLDAGTGGDVRWRVIWPDGSVHWIAGRWQVFMNESGGPSRMMGVNIDVTERKVAEEELSSIAGKLVEAQEQERKRIARELHDDIDQRLALLAVSLDNVSQVLPSSAAEAKQEIEHATKQVKDLGIDVQALSHACTPRSWITLGSQRQPLVFAKNFPSDKALRLSFTAKISRKISRTRFPCVCSVFCRKPSRMPPSTAVRGASRYCSPVNRTKFS
jgi:hypothetical protein